MASPCCTERGWSRGGRPWPACCRRRAWSSGCRTRPGFTRPRRADPALAAGSAELDALRQWQLGREVDRVRRTPHVRLPGVRSGLSTSPGLLLAPEGAADLRAGRAEVDVRDAAVRACGRDEPLGLADVQGEDR